MSNIENSSASYYYATEQEKTLRESESKYRRMVESFPQGVMIFQDGCCVFANHAAALLVGLQSVANLVGTPEHAFVAEWERDRLEKYARLAAEEAPTHYEIWMRRAEGMLFPAEIFVQTIAYEGKPARQVIAMDISARNEAQKALRKSEARYRHLLESISDSVTVLDRQWRYALVNEAAVIRLRQPKEKLIGTRIMDLFPGYEETVFFRAYQEVMETRRPQTAVDAFLFPDGRTGWFEAHIYPVPEGILCISRDITEQKKAEQALQESEERFRVLVETAPMPILIAQGGRFIYANAAASELFCYSREKLLHMAPWELAPPDRREMIKKQAMARLAGEQIPARFRDTVCTGEGQVRWVDLSTAVIECQGKPAILYVALDVTDRVLAEDRARENERFLNSILNSIQDGIAVLDKDLRIMRVNSATLQRHSHESVLTGKKCHEVFRKQSKPCRGCPAIPVLKKGVPQHQTQLMRMPDGTEWWADLHVFPLKNGDNQITGLVKFTRDITACKNAEARFERRHEVAEALLQISHHFFTEREVNIEDLLEILAETLRADCAYIHLFDEDLRFMKNAYLWLAEGVICPRNTAQKMDTRSFPWMMRQLEQNKDILIADVGGLSHKAAREKEILQDLGVRACIAVPIQSPGERLWGALGADSLSGETNWNEEDIRMLRTAGEMFAYYFHRQAVEHR